MSNKQDFIDKCSTELGGGYLAKLEAENLWYYFKKHKEAQSADEKVRTREKFFIHLRLSLERMALRREIRHY